MRQKKQKTSDTCNTSNSSKNIENYKAGGLSVEEDDTNEIQRTENDGNNRS